MISVEPNSKPREGSETLQLEAIASRLEAIASRLKAIAIRLEAIAIRYKLNGETSGSQDMELEMHPTYILYIDLDSSSHFLFEASHTKQLERFGFWSPRTRNTSEMLYVEHRKGMQFCVFVRHVQVSICQEKVRNRGRKLKHKEPSKNLSPDRKQDLNGAKSKEWGRIINPSATVVHVGEAASKTNQEVGSEPHLHVFTHQMMEQIKQC